jgi:hypothetical protein
VEEANQYLERYPLQAQTGRSRRMKNIDQDACKAADVEIGRARALKGILAIVLFVRPPPIGDAIVTRFRFEDFRTVIYAQGHELRRVG